MYTHQKWIIQDILYEILVQQNLIATSLIVEKQLTTKLVKRCFNNEKDNWTNEFGIIRMTMQKRGTGSSS